MDHPSPLPARPHQTILSKTTTHCKQPSRASSNYTTKLTKLTCQHPLAPVRTQSLRLIRLMCGEHLTAQLFSHLIMSSLGTETGEADVN